MDSVGSSTVLAGAAGGGRDKLSSLGDAALGHILSFLPATEAARMATLSRRWRHVFAAAHTVSLAEAEACFEMGYEYWRRCSSCGFNDESRAPRFVPGVTTALNARHRGARAATAPLRALRVAFDEFGFRGGDETTKAIDGWLSYAVHGAAEALEIDLRLGTEPICRWPYALVPGRGPRDAGERVVVDSRSRHDATNMDMHDDDDAADYSDDDDAAANDDGDDYDEDDDDDAAAADAADYSNDDDAAAYDEYAADYNNDDYAAADDDGDDYNEDDNDDAAAYDDGNDDTAAYDDGNDDAAADDGGSAATDDSSYSAAAATTADDDDDEEPDPDPMVYVVLRSVFSSCAVLRALRLGRCCIDLPSAIALPSLATLHLTRVTGRRGGGGTIQRLVSACPSLADLTLEACEDLTALSLHGASRLRRLALRCCHQLTTVTVGTPELRAFEYRGTIPPASLLTMHRRHRGNISFCAFDFCGGERGGELYGLTELLAGVERLHVTSARLGSCFVSYWGDSLCPCMPMLRSLEITGMLPDDDESAVSTVAGILERTPRLETLSLFFLPEPHPVKEGRYHVVEKEVLDATHELRYDPHALLAGAPPPCGVVEVPSCLRETTKEINLVHYQGSVAQRALAKFLLCNAAAVDEVCWKVARGPLSIQMKLMEEIEGWVMNKSAILLAL